ncbi:YqeG family HAD IIIA-type phosphatase [Ureibacillus thermophilus]|uniref:YqeG family HAD IIIA-type phosphatase n=1 Tax=Ureibacillus thermophilus TaxID=367743 RepID=A0A4P6UVT8_9BACL|nr:YqeG family HAD IIIA-type phosphatase [Ureibacillus thermophilus]QBK26306.1 YqeG family HAD IIIA-type phosphatase [Ureibacillus thermophilus]
MYKLFLPNEFVISVFEITPDKLKQRGIRGIITDLDNTLIEWNRADATDEIVEWLRMLKDAGIRVVIASNNSEARVKRFAEPLGIPYVYRAKKPLGYAYKAALEKLELSKNEVAMIGDQLLTDILGAKRLNLYTFLVRPVAESDGFVTRFNRFVERRVFKVLKRKGITMWEER